jgi:hypothetical protein
MRAFVIKASINEGNSKKKDPNGQNYTIASVTILVPFEPRSWNNANGTGSSRGFGWDTSEIELHPDALKSFQDVKFPCYLELETNTEFRSRGAVSVVTGCQKLEAKAA